MRRFAPALVLCNQEGIAVQVIHALRAIGTEIHALGGPDAHFLRWSRYLASFHALDCRIEQATPEALADRIAAIVRRHGIGIVLGSDFGPTRRLAELDGKLPVPIFPTAPPNILDIYHDKARFQDLARQAGAPVVEHVVFATKDALAHGALADRFGCPYVVKPTGEGNSNGVVVVDGTEVLRQRIIDNPHYRYAPLIVAPFVPGRDIGISLYAENGHVLASVCQTRAGFAVTFIDCPALHQAASRVVAAGGFSGVAHMDARLKPDGGIVLLECNARFWASMMAPAVAGVNFVEIGLAARFGGPIPRLPDITGRRATPPNRTLLGWFGRDPASPESRAWLRLAAKDPLAWLAGDVAYTLRRWRKVKSGMTVTAPGLVRQSP